MNLARAGLGIAAAAVLVGCGAPRSGAPLDTAARPPPAAQRIVADVPITLAASNAPAAQKLAHYRAIFEAAGGRWRPGRTHVLAIRGLDSTTNMIHGTWANPKMSDTIVVLRDLVGDPTVYEFVGSTHPGQATLESGRIGRDVNGDGIKDVGMVAEGAFRATSNGDFNGAPSFYILKHNGRDGLPAVRDTNQDGQHSPEEWEASRRRGDTAGEILFHIGFGQYVNSVGCFNVADYGAFVTSVGGPAASFEVAIINAQAREPR
ncbi:MAG: hypothetical protein RIT81_44270 [Deltaproteobacteria bacterium]